MTSIRTLILSLCIAGCPLIAAGDEPVRADLLLDALTESRSGVWQLADHSFANPAVNQWRLTGSLTEAGGEYLSRSDSRNPDPRYGLGEHSWALQASTYTKYRSSTLWGDASYTSGKTVDAVWNETADAELLYPYVMADSIGGDLKSERYSFHGGYADHTDRWAWGAELSYSAVQQYRDVDPRPRNVTGTLDVAAGAMWRFFGSYHAGIGLSMRKYKQTNDIDFKSEMGVDKIFHLTGLGNHYTRFDGTGLSTYYDGYRYGLDIDVYPSDGRGWFASCTLSRFTFKTVLSDLNKLPMASAWHNELSAQAGWMSPGGGRAFGGLSGEVRVYRRHGIENVFGDATSSIYPQIGSNAMYADNQVSVAARGRWGMRLGGLSRFHIEFAPGWLHRTTAYIEPYSYRVINHARLDASVSGTAQPSRYWLIDAAILIRSTIPYHCTLGLVPADEEVKALTDIERASFALDSARSTTVGAGVGATRTIASRYGLSVGGRYEHSRCGSLLSRNIYNLTIKFIF
ncbi:MAG: hypothetical protein K2K79_02260 [Paramuribaculum sp.]|nr:hypothetical protein [Paramuribaculum sp.]